MTLGKTPVFDELNDVYINVFIVKRCRNLSERICCVSGERPE